MTYDAATPCPYCKYDLTGLPDGACPECGVAFSRAMFEMIEQVKAQRREELRQQIRSSTRTCMALTSVVLSLSSVASMDEVGTFVLLVCLLWTFLSAAQPHNRWKAWNESPIHIVFPVIPALLFGWVVGILNLRGWIGTHIACTLSIVLALMALIERPRIAFVLCMIAIAPLHVRAVWLTIHAIDRRNKGWHWTDFDWNTPHQLSSRQAASISSADALWLGPMLIFASIAIVIILFFAVPRLTRYRPS